MASIFILFSLLLPITVVKATEFDRSFNQNYYLFWGFDHFKLLQGGDDEVQLVLDQSSGAGFKSKLEYESGRFHMRMKIPSQKSPGLIPNFYLISRSSGIRTELDFEFIGSTGVLQTNAFASDLGGREQRFNLWFDPSQDFHSYEILWNQRLVVFFVDDIPITAFKNYTSIGAKFPAEAMHIEATIWSSEWAGEVNWALSPFTTYYRNFTITACPADYSHTGKCSSPEYEWNQWELNPEQKQQLRYVRSNYMFYDYCLNKTSSRTMYPECSVSE